VSWGRCVTPQKQRERERERDPTCACVRSRAPASALMVVRLACFRPRGSMGAHVARVPKAFTR
jgi:hypothetical protein